MTGIKRFYFPKQENDQTDILEKYIRVFTVWEIVKRIIKLIKTALCDRSTCMLVIRNKMPPTARRERAGKSRMARTKKEKERKNITAVTFLFLLIFIFIYSDISLRTLT